MIASIIIIITVFVAIVGRQTFTRIQGNDGKTQAKESEATASGNFASESISKDESESAGKSESSANIKIVNSSFEPAMYKIKRGDRIIWQNEDSVNHTITSDEQDYFDSGNLGQDKTYTQKFEVKKIIPYHCEIHPEMKAEIIVE